MASGLGPISTSHFLPSPLLVPFPVLTYPSIFTPTLRRLRHAPCARASAPRFSRTRFAFPISDLRPKPSTTPIAGSLWRYGVPGSPHPSCQFPLAVGVTSKLSLGNFHAHALIARILNFRSKPTPDDITQPPPSPLSPPTLWAWGPAFSILSMHECTHISVPHFRAHARISRQLSVSIQPDFLWRHHTLQHQHQLTGPRAPPHFVCPRAIACHFSGPQTAHASPKLPFFPSNPAFYWPEGHTCQPYHHTSPSYHPHSRFPSSLPTFARYRHFSYQLTYFFHSIPLSNNGLYSHQSLL